MAFYKASVTKPQKLKRPLVLSFVGTGEVGCDGGALRKEFFEDALREVNNRLFEGEDNRRIPRKDVSLEFYFEVAGMIFSHSVLQEGAGLLCLSPAIYDYLSNNGESKR